MNVWDQDKYLEAWNYASDVHNGQALPDNDIPYINQLGLVPMEATATAAHGGVGNPDLPAACASLHDSIEDTSALAERLSTKIAGYGRYL